jgi:hypothetical protein
MNDKNEKNEVNAELCAQGPSGSLGRRTVHTTSGTRKTLQALEGFALVMLCSCKPSMTKQAVAILRDVRILYQLLSLPNDGDPCVLDIIDKACPLVLERVLPLLPGPDKVQFSNFEFFLMLLMDSFSRPLLLHLRLQRLTFSGLPIALLLFLPAVPSQISMRAHLVLQPTAPMALILGWSSFLSACILTMSSASVQELCSMHGLHFTPACRSLTVI